MKRALLAGLCAVVALSGTLFGAFDPLGFGAAAKGMGGAYTAVSEDAFSTYWNPAALSDMKKPQVATSWEDVYGMGLLHYMGFAYAHPGIGGGTFGLTWLRLGTAGEASQLKYSENTYIFSYGTRWKFLSLGANAKCFAVDGDVRGSGMGVDVAGTLEMLEKKVSLSLVATDVNQPKFIWESRAEDRLPRGLRAGLGWRMGSRMIFSLEEDWRGHDEPVSRAGLSFEPVKQRVFLRSGISRSGKQDEWEMSFGGGVRVSQLQFDLSWTRSEDLGDGETVSLLVRF